MSKRVPMLRHVLVKEQGARALIAAVQEFLRVNNVSNGLRGVASRGGSKGSLRVYRRMMRAYRDVPVLMANWFTNPKFLDKSGQPVPLTTGNGTHSIANLIKHSRVRVPKYLAVEMLTCSPSIRRNSNGTLTALRRVFVLPEFEVPRAVQIPHHAGP